MLNGLICGIPAGLNGNFGIGVESPRLAIRIEYAVKILWIFCAYAERGFPWPWKAFEFKR